MVCLQNMHIKFLYSEKATKFEEIILLVLTLLDIVKTKRMISSNFVAFSEYMNFIRLSSHIYLYPQMGPPFLEMAAATQFWHVTAAV